MTIHCDITHLDRMQLFTLITQMFHTIDRSEKYYHLMIETQYFKIPEAYFLCFLFLQPFKQQSYTKDPQGGF